LVIKPIVRLMLVNSLRAAIAQITVDQPILSISVLLKLRSAIGAHIGLLVLKATSCVHPFSIFTQQIQAKQCAAMQVYLLEVFLSPLEAELVHLLVVAVLLCQIANTL